MTYQVNGTNGEWQTGTTASNLNLNDTVYARLWDGVNAGDSVNTKITDTAIPNVAGISFNTTSTKTGTTITATVTQADGQSRLNIGACRWVYNNNSGAIGTNGASYTGGAFSTTPQTINLSTNTPGTYYLHVLSVDNAGNARESISGAVRVIAPGNPNGSGIFTENSTINGGGESHANPTIPKGFKPVNEGNAIWGSSNGYQYGLIIQDAEGNQFVWVPVDGSTVALNRYTFERSLGTLMENDRQYHEETTDSSGAGAKDINAFKNSVASHKGYYIARYEASNGGDGKPNSKVAAPWNNITQPNAAIAARNMYDSSYGATSDLVNSYAWDTALIFIQKYSGDSEYSQKYSLKLGTTVGTTGKNGDEKCHIHDMASNSSEWTTEKFEEYEKVYRGGNYSNTVLRAGSRGVNMSSYADIPLSFRPILYL